MGAILAYMELARGKFDIDLGGEFKSKLMD